MGTCNKHTPKFIPWLDYIHLSAPESASGKKKKKEELWLSPHFLWGARFCQSGKALSQKTDSF